MKPHEHVILEVARERERQMATEGWTIEHDNHHDAGELAQAASFYACNIELPYLWPGRWGWQWNKRAKHSRRKQLVIAAALIVAELERLDRMAPKEDVMQVIDAKNWSLS